MSTAGPTVFPGLIAFWIIILLSGQRTRCTCNSYSRASAMPPTAVDHCHFGILGSDTFYCLKLHAILVGCGCEVACASGAHMRGCIAPLHPEIGEESSQERRVFYVVQRMMSSCCTPLTRPLTSNLPGPSSWAWARGTGKDGGWRS